MAVGDLHAQGAIYTGRFHMELRFDAGAECSGIGGLQDHYVATDFLLELRRRAFGHDTALVNQNQTVALVGFIENVAGEQNGYAFLLS